MRISDWSSDVCSSDLAAAWEKWLAAHRDARGIWLKIAKKDSGIASVTYAEALDVALCHGWNDGQKRGCDAQCFLQRFTPRRPKGVWSKINIGHRSEEHTSELQSLMRISYAVFCLKNKTTIIVKLH